MKAAPVIDNLRIIFDCHISIDDDNFGYPFQHKSLLFVPRFDNRLGLLTSYEGSLCNLRVRYFPSSGKLLIDNSIHKYFHGNNHCDFTRIEISEAFARLSDELNLDIGMGKIQRLEYGLNIAAETAIRPHQALLSLKSKDHKPMQAKGKEYGSNCIFSDYTVKCYNKKLEVKLHDKVDIEVELFRWEVAVKAMRCLHNKRPQVPIFTINDLLQPDKLQYLADDLVNKFRDSQRRPVIDYNTLSMKEKNIVARMEHSKIKQAIRSNHYDTYRKDTRDYKNIQNRCNEQASFMESLLIEKCCQLISN